jgi:hypothetical protein
MLIVFQLTASTSIHLIQARYWFLVQRDPRSDTLVWQISESDVEQISATVGAFGGSYRQGVTQDVTHIITRKVEVCLPGKQASSWLCV